MEGIQGVIRKMTLTDKEQLQAINEILAHLVKTDSECGFDYRPDETKDDVPIEHTLEDAIKKILKITNTYVGYPASETDP